MIPAILALAAAFSQVIPDSATLMKDVEAHQRKMDEIRENYTFHETMRTDDLDAKGSIRKTETEEREVFFVNGRRVARLVKKNGKELSPGDRKSEDERVKRAVEKDIKSTPGVDREMAMLTQIVGIMTISNPRRTSLNGRNTLAFDFIGDRKAKTHGIAENAAKKIAGTVWIDEADRQVARLEARLEDAFRIGGGLLASVQKGTFVHFEQSPLTHEFWMPSNSEIHLAAREFLVSSIRQNIQIKDFDFRRFDIGVLQQQSPPQ